MGNEMLMNIQGFNPSLDSWQDETNADKFGNVDETAAIFERAGLETLTFPTGENLQGEEYNNVVFLEIASEHATLESMGNYDYQQSFDLRDAVNSTGKE